MGWWITLGILALLAVLPLGVSVRYDEDGAVVKVIAGPIKITLFPRPKKEKKPKKEKQKKEQKTKTAPASEQKQEPPPELPESAPQEPAKPVPEVKEAVQPTETKPEAVEPSKPAEINPDQKPAETPEVTPEKSAQSPPEEKKPAKKGGSVLDFLPLVRILFDFLGDFWGKLRVNLLVLRVVLGGDDPCDLAVNYGRAWTALGNLLPRLERIMVIQKRDISVQCDFTSSKTLITARLDLTITLGRLLAAVFVFIFRALVEFIKIKNKQNKGRREE